MKKICSGIVFVLWALSLMLLFGRGEATGASDVEVNGSFSASGFTGDGSALTNINALSITGIVPITNGGTGSSSQNFVDLTTIQAIGGTKTFSNTINGNISGNAATATTAGVATTAHSVDALSIVTESLAAGAVTPAKMASSCGDNQVLKFTGTLWTCATYNTGTVTSFAAGTGLSGGTIDTTGTIGVNFAGSGSANTVARSDHDHSGTYQQFNPLQVALLRWYDVNKVTTFTGGGTPIAVAFDGANIWVANFDNNNVTKFNAATGALVGTYGVGTNPLGVAFDGANIWVANYGSNNVTKLNAATGVLVDTYGVGTNPHGIAFDGANIWVTNRISNNVTKLNAATGALVDTYAVGTNPYSVAFDGANIWVANYDDNTVTKLNAATGALEANYEVGSAPIAVAFDGANIWVANNVSNNVTKLNAATGALVANYEVGSNPHGIVFDGANIWAANNVSNNVTKLNAATGALIGTYAVGTAPWGIAFDGVNIWVANTSSNNVTKL